MDSESAASRLGSIALSGRMVFRKTHSTLIARAVLQRTFQPVGKGQPVRSGHLLNPRMQKRLTLLQPSGIPRHNRGKGGIEGGRVMRIGPQCGKKAVEFRFCGLAPLTDAGTICQDCSTYGTPVFGI